MKNIQKLGIVLTLFTFTSVGCSSEVVQEETSLPTQEVLSENEEVMPENQELVSENEEVMLENQELASENEEVMLENQAVLPENQEVSSNLPRYSHIKRANSCCRIERGALRKSYFGFLWRLRGS